MILTFSVVPRTPSGEDKYILMRKNNENEVVSHETKDNFTVFNVGDIDVVSSTNIRAEMKSPCNNFG